MPQVPARFFWAVTWEPRRYVLTRVSVKNRREPGTRGMLDAQILEAERAFMFNVLFLDRMQLVPQRQGACDDDSDEYADQKEPAISGKRYEQNCDYGDGDDERSRAFEAESRPAARSRLHEFILARHRVSPANASSEESALVSRV